MPKLVTQAQINRWRELLSHGKNYKEIAKATGWQERTVRKHLESDIKSSAAVDIRRELFKDRLGEHWDMLLDGILAPLSGLGPLPPQDDFHLWWFGTSDPDQREIMQVSVTKDADWGLTVGVGSRSLVEWPLLFQHIPRDPLWSAVESWEAAFKADLLSRRDLYLAVEGELVGATGLPLVERLSGEPALTKRVAYAALQQAHLRVLDLPARDVSDESVSEGSAGSLEVLGIPHAGIGPGLGPKVVAALQKAVTPWEEESGKAKWKKAYTDLEAASAELHRTVTHLRLLRYLPGVCDVCGRFEV